MKENCRIYRFPWGKTKEYIVFVVFEDDKPIDVFARYADSETLYLPLKIIYGNLTDNVFRYHDKGKHHVQFELIRENIEPKHEYVKEFIDSVKKEVNKNKKV